MLYQRNDMFRIFLLIWCFLFLACGVKINETLPKSVDKKLFNDLNQSKFWWKAYENKKLDDFIDFVLLNNSDINTAKLSLLSTLARAGLVKYDLYPSLSGDLALSKSKNLNSGISSAENFSHSLNLSYELDIYAKLLDSAKAREFDAKASKYDLENLKLSIINSSLNNVFELAYFNDVEFLLKDYIANLEQMKELYTFKYDLGKIEELDLLNITQSLLRAKQNLLTNEQNKDVLIKNLQDLLGKKEGFVYIEYFKQLSLSDFKELKPNFDIPLEVFAYRPDVQAKFNKLKAAFKDYQSIQKSLFPSISFGAVLSGNDEKFKESFKFEILSGNLRISLPFLDYARVRQNIKISEFAYQSLLFEYEQILQSAMNEFLLNYKNYQNTLLLLGNLQVIKDKQEKIAFAYLQKYELGKSELRDYLDANNALNSSLQELLRARYNLLTNINFYHKITSFEEEF